MQNFLKTYFKGDTVIWALYAILVVTSMIVMYSASSTIGRHVDNHFSPLWSHITFLAMGFVLLYLFYRLIPFKMLDKYALLIYVVCFVLLAFATLKGHAENGASRWIRVMGIQFQPSEMMKFAIILMLAKVLTRFQSQDEKTPDNKKETSDDKKRTPDKGIWWYCAIWLLPGLLILRENFSTFLLLSLVCFSMIFFARISWMMIGKVVGALLLLLLLVVGAVKLYTSGEAKGTAQAKTETSVLASQFHRVDTWINRFTNHSEEALDSTFKITDANYQVSHARIAVANGCWHGLGPGNSIERDFLPQAYSDFVFSIIIEEYGIFSWVIIIVYLVLLYRVGMLVCNQCRSFVQSLVVLGLTCLIVYQAFVNISVAVGLIPVTGQPLPLISRGGTCILMTSIYFGVILGISRSCQEVEEAERLSKAKSKPQPTVEEEAAKETPAVVEIPSSEATV